MTNHTRLYQFVYHAVNKMAIKNGGEQLKIEYRRQCIKDTWIKLGVFGVTQQKITNQLKEDFGIEVTQVTVSRDLKVIKQRIKNQSADELRSEIFAGYMRLITEAREGWRRSLEDAVTETSEVIEGPAFEGKNQKLKAQTRTTGQSGNPAFLKREEEAFAAMRKMFGVDLERQPGSTADNPVYHRMVVLPPKDE